MLFPEYTVLYKYSFLQIKSKAAMKGKNPGLFYVFPLQSGIILSRLYAKPQKEAS